ncbi:MAG: hypothetical protein R3D86_12955 [Emcibacteraceae bacterium]
MILRRFMKNVTKQNWIAVALDLIVVIVGIFLGLQVQSWYDGRKTKSQEYKYLENLHQDIEANLKLIFEGYSEQKDIQNGIINILDYYAGEKGLDALTSADCSALALSHKQANPISNLPVAQELVSSGNFQIISDENIRRAMSDYISILDLLRDRRESTQLFMVDMTSLYPEIINVDLKIARKRLENIAPSHQCHFEAGATNTLFKNQLAMNSTRQWQLTRTIEEQLASLEKLHQLVDQRLGITH